MKNHQYNLIILLLLGMIYLFTSCQQEEDYSHIVFSNYLGYEIKRATQFLGTTAEGTEEGQYDPGSKQAYQDVIDAAKVVDENTSATQTEVDQAYEALLQAGEDFFDHMVPFRSVFQDLILYVDVTLANTEEGDQEGQVKQGSKKDLQDASDEAKQLVARTDLTQRMLDEGTTGLTDALYTFNRNINGRASVVLQNHSFEHPGYATTDFDLVAGWDVFGEAESWAPLAEIAEGESVPDGRFFAKIGSYTQGIYQPLVERIHPNAEYTLNFEVSLLQNAGDWQGKKHKVILRSRIVSFGQEPGDYDFAEIILESYDTLGLNPGDFIEIQQSISIEATSAFVGKEIAVDFEQRHTWSKDEPIWAESFVALDNVRLYRKMN